MRLLAFSLLGLAWIGCGADDGSFSGAGTGAASGTGAATGTTTSTWVTTTTTTQTDSGGASTSTSSSSSSSASSSSSGGTGGSEATSSGDCKTDADCPSGHCVAITPGGFKVCFVAPVAATGCTGPLDQCCPATQQLCAMQQASCFVGPLVPVCAGVAMPAHNVCGVDQCAKDVDCAAGQICAPAGTLGLEIRACIAAHCKLDTDCAAYPGGVCAPAQDPCCAATDGLFCVYPSDGGCRKNADCPPTTSQPSRYCAPDPVGGSASCQPGSPICPA